MRKFVFTKELLVDYYDDWFSKDLRAFFQISRFQGFAVPPTFTIYTKQHFLPLFNSLHYEM